MKRSSIVAAILALCLCAGITEASAQTGLWSGKLEFAGMSLNLVFNLDDEDCSLSSPDQGAYDIAASLERSADGISVAIPAINAVYKGTLQDGKIVGTYTQHGQSFPMTLTPGNIERKRPQTPVAPFPYVTEEVSFSNGDAVLAGTLTLPENAGKDTPVLIMVTGSGLQNRDEEIYEHRPFAVIADAFARKGIATLRYDDRGFGESTGDLINVTVEDLKNDALAGIDLLRTRFSKVGVLGHSEGGSIALMLAAEGKADFVISLAGAFVPLKRTLVWQNRLLLQAAGYSETVIEKYCQGLEEIFNTAVATNGTLLTVPQIDGLPKELEQNMPLVTRQCSTPYMCSLLALDLTGSRLSGVTCPVLAMNGRKDWQVECDANLNALRDALSHLSPDSVSDSVSDSVPDSAATNRAATDRAVTNSAATDSVQIYALEGLNHMFQHCETGNPSEYKDIEETIAPEVLELMLTFLASL